MGFLNGKRALIVGLYGSINCRGIAEAMHQKARCWRFHISNAWPTASSRSPNSWIDITFAMDVASDEDIASKTPSQAQHNHVLLDFFAFTLSPTFSYASGYTDSGDHIPSISYGLSVGFSWYPMFDPAHLIEKLPDGGFRLDPKSWMYNPNYPIVFNLGFTVGLTVNQYLPGYYDNGKEDIQRRKHAV